jgi:sterol desaturase/sphingolipid hydroxylase (fatty acid hydroxylase superfamily)
VTNGIANYLFGDTAYQYALADSNIILVFFIHVYVHLQHSHVWISFTDVLGRIFVSPAHHQVHHSADPKHFNRNFGSCPALWDWMFGTLYVPGKEREKLIFGVAPDRFPAHTITGELVAPFIRGAAYLRTMLLRRPPALPAASTHARNQASRA